MLNLRSLLKLTLITSVYGWLTACGNGGGGGDSSNETVEDSAPSVQKSTISIPTETSRVEDIVRTLGGFTGVFTYKSDGDIYLFFSGEAEWSAGQPGSIFTVDSVPSQILKKTPSGWEFSKTDNNASFWGIRNFELIGNQIILGDGNEIGLAIDIDTSWRGPAFFGKIGTGGDIAWTQVNDNSETGYFHGTGAGDLNKDGLTDVAVTPGIQVGCCSSGPNLFLQNGDGSFTRNDSLIDIVGDPPFTVDIADITGDDRDEIITADYGGGSIPDADDHEIKIYKFDDMTGKFELFYQNNDPSIYSFGLGATSIKTHDFNNDGINDIAVAREDLDFDGFEVWRGNSDGSYEVSFSSPTWTREELLTAEFSVFDANNDGFLDILLRPQFFGTLFRNAANCSYDIVSCEGVQLNNLIWLNNGDATFSAFSAKELVYPDVDVDALFPYKDGDSLHFVGTYWPSVTDPVFDIYDIKVDLNN